MGQPAHLAAIFQDLHASLDRLNASLFPASQSHPPPPLPTHNHSTSFKPVIQLPPLNPIPRLATPIPPKTFTDVIRDSILSQPVTLRYAPAPKIPKNPSHTRASAKLDRLRSLSKKGTAVCFKCGETGHTTTSCRNATVCFACQKTGHRSFNCKTTSTIKP